MLLRRVIEHVNAQNWTAVVLDFAIVVCGVLLAIQVSSWESTRADRRDEQAFLKRLQEDLLEVEQLAGRLVGFRLDLIAQNEAGVDILFAEDPERELNGDDCAGFATSHLLYVGRADLPSLQQLWATGRFDIVRDAPLAQSLSALVQRREAMALTADQLGKYSVDLTQAYPDIFTVKPAIIPVANADGETERSLDIACDFDLLRETPAAMNALVTNLEWQDGFRRDGLIPWLEQLEAVHTRVDYLLGGEH